MARTFTTPPPVRVWEAQLRTYRAVWRSNVLGSFVQPFLYLLGMGLGVGALVDNGSNSDELLGGLVGGRPQEHPSWATFDEDTPSAQPRPARVRPAERPQPTAETAATPDESQDLV